jgi:hypothetical protein
MSDKPKTYIIVIEPVGKSLARDAGTFAMFAALIGLGVLLDSAAMQWVGAIIGFLAIFAKVGTIGARSQFKTAEDAISFIRKEAAE